MSKYLRKRGRSPPAAAVVYPDVTEDEVVSAADKVPELSEIAVTLRTLLPEPGNEMDVATATSLESSLLAVVTAVQSTTFGDKNPKLAALGVAAIRYLGLYEDIVNVCLLAFSRTQITFVDNLHFVTKRMLSKEVMERFKLYEVNAMIDRICNVDGINFPPLSTWSMDSYVKYEWNKFVKGGSAFAYRNAKARAAVCDQVQRVI